MRVAIDAALQTIGGAESLAEPDRLAIRGALDRARGLCTAAIDSDVR